MNIKKTQTENAEKRRNIFELSSFALHIIAMVLMLSDHLWATVVPGQAWMTWLGRISYPIFAFMIVEGYFYTSDIRKYMKRLLVFALLSEIPFNLMYSSSVIYPFHQNVLWTFLIALLCLKSIDRTRVKYRAKAEKQSEGKPMPIWQERLGINVKAWPVVPLSLLWVLLYMLLAILTMTDYNAGGVLMVVLFYLMRGRKWYHYVGQLAGMVYINCSMLKGLVVPVEVFGVSMEIPQQGFAVLALLPIWLYRGRRGFHNKVVQYVFYAFYPIHLLILGLLGMR